MLAWLKSVFGSGEPDEVKQITAEWELSRKLAPIVAAILQLPIQASGRTAESLYDEQPAFMCGYLAGLADVLGQGYGGTPGANLSQNLALRLMIELFGQQQAEGRWPEMLNYMHSGVSEFERGMSIGGQDGNRFLEKGFPRNLAVHLGIGSSQTGAP